MAYWKDNLDSWICSSCGFETDNPNRFKMGSKRCPRCREKMEPLSSDYDAGWHDAIKFFNSPKRVTYKSFCPYCKKELDNAQDKTRCKNCGILLEW